MGDVLYFRPIKLALAAIKIPDNMERPKRALSKQAARIILREAGWSDERIDKLEKAS